MKIAQICPRYAPYIGGVETHVAEISKRLVRAGHDVTVLTTDPSGKLARSEDVDGVKVIRFPVFAPGDAYYISPSIGSFLRSHNNYDIVHAHGYHALPAFFASSSRAAMFVFTPHYHGKGHTGFRDMLLKPYRLMGEKIFSRADRIICVSSFEKGLICRDFKKHCNKATVIPNGVDMQDFSSIKPYEKSMKSILYVGRLEEYKGVQYVIRAMPLLKDHEFIVIGKGPYKEKLIEEAKESGVSNRVKFLEGLSREDLLRWYATADIFVMLSKFEAYGITVAEALSAGVPCVVARSSALEEFVDGKSCRSVDLPVDIETLALEINSSNFEGIVAQNILDWDDVTEKLLDVYGVIRT